MNKLAKIKTKETKASVEDFINSVKDEVKRKDSLAILKLMQKATKEKPKMWGSSIVGFGSYHYKYESGREGDFFRIGYSPRVQNLTVYVMDGFEKRPDLMDKLGKHTTGKSCLYIKRLSDIDEDVLPVGARLEVAHHREQHLASDVELPVAGIVKAAGAGQGHDRGLAPCRQGQGKPGQETHRTGMAAGLESQDAGFTHSLSPRNNKSRATRPPEGFG